jgi:hypothetical protein
MVNKNNTINIPVLKTQVLWNMMPCLLSWKAEILKMGAARSIKGTKMPMSSQWAALLQGL